MLRRMPRRAFVSTMAGLVLGLLPGRVVAPRTARAARGLVDLELAQRLTGLLRAQPGVALLGKMFLWKQSVPPTVGELVDAVLPGSLKNQHLRSERWQLRRAVKARLVSDYAALRVVPVGAWLLSITECRIAALAALDSELPG